MQEYRYKSVPPIQLRNYPIKTLDTENNNNNFENLFSYRYFSSLFYVIQTLTKVVLDFRFYIQEKQNGNGQVVLGSEDLIFATHCIRFETPLEDVNSSYDKYPFSWKIIDIDFEYNEKDH